MIPWFMQALLRVPLTVVMLDLAALRFDVAQSPPGVAHFARPQQGEVIVRSYNDQDLVGQKGN